MLKDSIKNTQTLEKLQELYTATYGKNGTMTLRLKEMKNMDNDARAELNRENAELRELFKVRQSEIENAVMMAALEKQKLDVFGCATGKSWDYPSFDPGVKGNCGYF